MRGWRGADCGFVPVHHLKSAVCCWCSIKFDAETIRTRLREVAFLNSSAVIKFMAAPGAAGADGMTISQSLAASSVNISNGVHSCLFLTWWTPGATVGSGMLQMSLKYLLLCR